MFWKILQCSWRSLAGLCWGDILGSGFHQPVWALAVSNNACKKPLGSFSLAVVFLWWFSFFFISSALKLLGVKSQSSWRREGRLYVQEMLMGWYKWEGAGGVEGRQPQAPELVSCAWDLHQGCHTPLRKTFWHLWLQEGIRDFESVLKTKIGGEGKPGQAVVSVDFQFFPEDELLF